MISASLERLVKSGVPLSVLCRFEPYDDEDSRRALTDGEWQVFGMFSDGEGWLASLYDEGEAQAFAKQVRLLFGVPDTV